MAGNAWRVDVRERDDKGRIRWYCLAWTFATGPAPKYLKNGRTMGSYRYKRDASAAAERANREARATITPRSDFDVFKAMAGKGGAS